MTPMRFLVLRPRLYALTLVLLGMPVASAHAQDAPVSAAESTSPSSAAAPTSLTALRVELLVPPRPPSERPPPRDLWLARDKARHVVFSGLWTLSAQYVLVHKADWSERDALPVSMAASGAVGVAKELYDASRRDGRASGKDLVANAVGIGLAMGVIVL